MLKFSNWIDLQTQNTFTYLKTTKDYTKYDLNNEPWILIKLISLDGIKVSEMIVTYKGEKIHCQVVGLLKREWGRVIYKPIKESMIFINNFLESDLIYRSRSSRKRHEKLLVEGIRWNE